jgi:hypothetical protein
LAEVRDVSVSFANVLWMQDCLNKMIMKRSLLAAALAMLCVAFPIVASAQVSDPKPYETPLPHRAICKAELEKDANLRAFCKAEWTAELHDQDAKNALTNKKHVVMAYAAIWIIMMIFVVMMWLRQGKLKAEIDRLEKDLAKALEND